MKKANYIFAIFNKMNLKQDLEENNNLYLHTFLNELVKNKMI